MRDLGKAGESVVDSWCAMAGITANPSFKDRYGWDLLFELESASDLATASGLHESNIECKVQVKATDSATKTRKIELSNLRSMATSALPAFYLLLEYGGSDAPQAGYLLHLDDSHCEKILRRIRAETARPGKLSLNKKTMTLDFKEARKIHPLNGLGLRSAVLEFVGSSQGDYVLKKQSFLKRAGYEAGGLSIKFNLPAQHIQKFVEMASGTKAQLEVQDIKSFHTRFGITEKLALINSESALLTIGGVVADDFGKVSFTDQDTGTMLTFDLDVYRGGLGNWVPSQYRMIRLVSQRFTIDISVTTSKCKIWFHKTDYDSASLRDLYKQFRFTQMLTKPKSVDLVLLLDHKELKGSLGGEGFEDQSWACTVLKSALAIQNHYEDYDDIFTSLADLSSKDKDIVNFHRFLSEPDSELDVNLTFVMSAGTEKIAGAECLVPLVLSFGGVMFVSLYAFGGVLEASGENAYHLKALWKRCIYKMHFRELGGGAETCLKNLKKAADEYSSECTVIDLTEKYIKPIAKVADMNREVTV